MSTRFNILAAEPAAVLHLQQELGLPRFIASTMVARGICNLEKAQEFLRPSLDRDWLNPYLISGISEAADTVIESIKARDHILVFGDFDLDGISATATLTHALRELGAAKVSPFIPLRFEEGYGLSEASLQRVFKYKPDLIITVDCGIANKHEAEMVQEAGIKLVVTDHHEPADLVPCGIPLVDPKLEKNGPSTILAGAGVALKLVQALGGRLGQPHLWQDYTDLVALGTVADLMPMLSENRALVADGIHRMNVKPRACLAALFQTAGVAGREITATNISFSIIPRLNAAGRMGDAQLAVDLLLSERYEDACHYAEKLEILNDKRRQIEAELSVQAKLKAANVFDGQRALVVSGEDWHEGVKGIVASRLTNIYGVPSLLFTIDGDEARGSGRSIGQVNLFKAVESVSDILTRFGGHEAAVGITLPADKLDEFVRRINEHMDTLPAESFLSRVDIDACVDLEELSLENVAKLDTLAPFGQENRVPCYMTRDVFMTNMRAVGADKNHFSCTLTDGKNSIPSIMFHCSDIEMLMHCGSMVNAAFELQIDEWRGRKSVKAMLKALVPARACGALEACLDPANLEFVADLYSAGEEDSPYDPTQEDPELSNKRAAEKEKNRALWSDLAKQNHQGLQESIVARLIGDESLHASQKEALEQLAAGKNTMAVMPTGRGKSLIFYIHAILEALTIQGKSLFIYPLRALIADQAFYMQEVLGEFGLSAEVLTGETDKEERSRIFSSLKNDGCDIILTTPEFFNFHVEEFKESAEIGFIVVDEAHHIGLAKAGHRLAYRSIGKSIEKLGDPRVLALTATADSDTSAAIKRILQIEHVVCDETRRSNLVINDQRNLKSRDNYLAALIAQAEKTIIYVNSRERSIALARELRHRAPQMASLIGFYHAGLTREERKRVEDLFRRDSLCVLVATSAFGEGVNIPHVRHVVLYHLPFNEVEFNQMSGRAGRDGGPATVHLLFGRYDASINEKILYDTTPSHECMAQVYRELKKMQRVHGEEFFVMDSCELATLASKHSPNPISGESIACGISVFRELGLIETRAEYGEGGVKRYIRVLNTQSKVKLTDSIRYSEGLGEWEVFSRFRDWAMKSTSDTLQERIVQAILPKCSY